MYVSILYEVPRVCNAYPGHSYIEEDEFQSSTRFLEFATRADYPRAHSIVSILYEVPRVCNGTALGMWRPAKCFNPLRGSSSLQQEPRAATGGLLRRFNPLRGSSSLQHLRVDGRNGRGRSFNPLRGSSSLQPRGSSPAIPRPGPVSILYEVPRVCNVRHAARLRPGLRFNPLRGSSSLQR